MFINNTSQQKVTLSPSMARYEKKDALFKRFSNYARLGVLIYICNRDNRCDVW